MTTLHTNPRSSGQFPKEGNWLRGGSARVKLLPLRHGLWWLYQAQGLHEGWYERPTAPDAPIPSAAKPVTDKVRVQQKRSPFFDGWTLLPMRLFLGVTCVYAGVQKLTDPQFLHPSSAGYIGNQLRAFAQGSPLHDLFMGVAVPHAIFLGNAITFGEITIGLGILLGLLFRPAAFFGLMLSLTSFLSIGWRVHPYFYGADIVFAFCWLVMLLHGPVATGYPALDAWFIPKLFPLQTLGTASFTRVLLIGSPDRLQTAVLAGESSDSMAVGTSVQQGNT